MTKKQLIHDALLLAGALLIGVGLWLLSPAAALIFGGLFIAGNAVLLSAQARKQ